MVSRHLALYGGIPLLIIMTLIASIYCWRTRNWNVAALGSLLVLYIAGKTGQCFHELPRLIRWYFADIGWVPGWTFVALIGALQFPQISVAKAVKIARNATLIGLSIATANELLTFWAAEIGARKGLVMKAPVAGDPIDIGIYIVMFFVARFFLDRAAPQLTVYYAES